MPDCQCPNCRSYFKASSYEFGLQRQCEICGFEFKLDIDHLARYNLPSLIRIQLVSVDGAPFTKFSVPVLIQYGYSLPPIQSNLTGQLLVTREMFSKAHEDHISTGTMDHKGDYSLKRYIEIYVPSRNDAITISKQRDNSGWPILSFEQELYSDMPSLLAAYIPKEEIEPVSTKIDLFNKKDTVELEMILIQPDK